MKKLVEFIAIFLCAVFIAATEARPQSNFFSPSERLDFHFNRSLLLAIKLKKVALKHEEASKNIHSRKCFKSSGNKTDPERHFRFLYNIMQNANRGLLANEIQAAVLNLLQNSRYLSTPDQDRTHPRLSSTRLSLQCLHTIADYGEYVSRWHAGKELKMDNRCFLYPLRAVCSRILASCNCSY